MSLEDLLIAYSLLALLTPTQVDELAYMLDYLHLPYQTPALTLLPLQELRKAVIVEFGECRAAEQLTRLIQGNAPIATTPPDHAHDTY